MVAMKKSLVGLALILLSNVVYGSGAHGGSTAGAGATGMSNSTIGSGALAPSNPSTSSSSSTANSLSQPSGSSTTEPSMNSTSTSNTNPLSSEVPGNNVTGSTDATNLPMQSHNIDILPNRGSGFVSGSTNENVSDGGGDSDMQNNCDGRGCYRIPTNADPNSYDYDPNYEDLD